jgi:DNA-binding transcriptional LysR family regulator
VADAFRLAVVPGVTVDRWARTWSERRPEVALELVPAPAAGAVELLAGGAVDAALVRLPVDQDTFHAIPLYTEATVVVVPRDHLLTAADELTLADLADETRVTPRDDVLGSPDSAQAADQPETTATAVEFVAAGVGVLVTPMSLARLHHRRDLTFRPVTDAPTSSVALAWRRDGHTELVEEMIGIVRGRTANSTRGQAPVAPARKPGAGAGRTPPASGRPGARRAGTQPRRRGR